jgi:hypothetical protein
VVQREGSAIVEYKLAAQLRRGKLVDERIQRAGDKSKTLRL